MLVTAIYLDPKKNGSYLPGLSYYISLSTLTLLTLTIVVLHGCHQYSKLCYLICTYLCVK